MQLGKLVMTQGVSFTCDKNPQFYVEVIESLKRYIRKDWGVLCDEDKQVNENALIEQNRILAKYNTCEEDIYIITEWDRSCTTVLFPHEY